MTIEAYLSGAADYDALSDAERCAICAAMEGELVLLHTEDDEIAKYVTVNKFWTKFDKPFYDYVEDYSWDGTAALRLVERFRINVAHAFDWGTMQECWGARLDSEVDCLPASAAHSPDIDGFAPTPQAAIVSAVCALARVQYPYKAINQ